MSSLIKIYTDGACKGNPGPGGWGALLTCNGKEKELFGGESNTTNNRMELMAVIRALEAIRGYRQIQLHVDSKYVMNGCMTWMENWKKNGWRTSSRGEVKNVDLWKRLDELLKLHNIEWCWIKGHSGHPENERADALANRGVNELQ